MVQRHGEQPAPDTPANGAAEQATDLETQLIEERERAQDYLARYQRAAADYQNLKRRTEQEREELSRYANTALILNILPAVDDFDRALANVDPALDGSSWVEGVRAIQRKLKGALEASGVTEIVPESDQFDPNLQEAIGHVAGPSGHVIHEARRGYRLGNRVIRHAQVLVGNGEGENNS
jgi:molecular chaperone GrpE